MPALARNLTALAAAQAVIRQDNAHDCQVWSRAVGMFHKNHHASMQKQYTMQYSDMQCTKHALRRA